MSTSTPIAPRWLSFFPYVFWSVSAVLLPVLAIKNANVRNALAPPLGPAFTEKGDVPKEAGRKGWLLSWFPFCFLASAIIGLGGDDPLAAEPTLKFMLMYFILPFAISTIVFHMMIDFRRSRGIHCADAFLLIVCTVFQIGVGAAVVTWGIYMFKASGPGGTLASDATRVRLSASLSLLVMYHVLASMVWRLLALRLAHTHKKQMDASTVTEAFEDLYLGPSLAKKAASVPKNPML
mmetsp:Transcript_26762/g.78844  ORF Transcript_26762/g.78844 Transcript_26762/m.78844 type:complete len:236 (+) Transcript_26762:52-759(+)